MSLVLHIPGMIREWALRPVAEAGRAAERAVSQAPEVAVRLIAAFA
jgi:hypothetical protein